MARRTQTRPARKPAFMGKREAVRTLAAVIGKQSLPPKKRR